LSSDITSTAFAKARGRGRAARPGGGRAGEEALWKERESASHSAEPAGHRAPEQGLARMLLGASTTERVSVYPLGGSGRTV